MKKTVWQATSIVVFFLIVGLLVGAMPLPAAAVIALFSAALIIYKWFEISKPKRLLKSVTLARFSTKKS
ncbi:hypothetical protein [Thalassotalea sp. PLHSN55]|uniref:hypothetical protein n=1 Tax=Thalassotalea sp. PLHSN55 TaxID=3435888 RepID=UPI003F87D0E6